MMDESTDVGKTNCLTIVVKYYDVEEDDHKTAMLELMDVYGEDNIAVGSTGEALYTNLVGTLDHFNIPRDNFIGFASDGTNNMFGEHNSVVSRLRVNFPGI